jgi:peptidylprolyl isomerase/peptidyl-prolyl cis-trans isomerase B (cyclophilin B)
MDVVDAIAAVPTGNRGPNGDVPVDPIVMKRVTVLPAAAGADATPATPPANSQ